MSGLIRIQYVPQFRDVKGRFAKANKTMEEEARESLRVIGRRYVAIAQDEAPKGPTSTGRFWRGIGYRTYKTGKGYELRTFSPQPLGTWITKGTKPHIIRPKTPGGALYFFWPKGGGKYFTFKMVHHPGTRPNPYHKRAYDRWWPEVRAEVQRLTKRVVVRLAGRNV